MTVLVKALGYYSHKGGRAAGGLAKAKSHLKYLEHGKTHENEPRGFDADRDRVSRKEFYEQLREQPERGVIAHKLVFSLSEQEQERLGIDLKELVRETMADYQAQTGRALGWIGFEHRDPGHPHVHVVVAGYDRAGKQVGLYPRDLQTLRRAADRQKDRLAAWTRATGLDRQARSEARLAPELSRAAGRQRDQGLLERVWETLREILQRDGERRGRDDRGHGLVRVRSRSGLER